LLSTAALGAFGCQQVAGIEERHYAGPSSNDVTPSQACVKYCDTVAQNCTGDLAVYKSNEICLDVCMALPAGDVEASGNSVTCRQFQADAAAREPADSCPKAGPGGGGACGTDCEAWCGLLEKACPDDYATLGEQCEQRCKALSDDGGFDVTTYYTGDTLQCRLIHVGAALSDPTTHCAHAAFLATSLCVPGPKEPPTCEKLCQTAQAICTGDLAVYESAAQCLAACKVFPLGQSSDTTENTVGCRIYHALTASGAPSTHCMHAGPTGDGHCGQHAATDATTGNCESYCELLEAACKTDPGYKFASVTACEAACKVDLATKGAAPDSGYAIKDAQSGDTLKCRTLQAVRALTAMTTDACPAALGTAKPCQ
jgi:hypothetical protein